MRRRLDKDDVPAFDDTSGDRIVHAIALAVAAVPNQSPFNCLECELFGTSLNVNKGPRPDDAKNP